MQYIDFKVQHQTITRTDKYEVVGGSQNYLYARFTFCAEWDDITATAVFSTNNGKHYSALVKDGECLVPWEVLTGAEFWVGVFGGERMTTSTARVPVKPGVKTTANPGMPPSPTAYETLIANAAASAKAAEEAQSAAEKASEDAVSAAENAAASRMAADESQKDAAFSKQTATASAKTAASAAARAEAARSSIVLDENKLSQKVSAAEASAKTAETAAARAQAEAERVRVPAAAGVYNVVLTDRITNERWALIVENGRLALLGVSSALDCAEVNLIDNGTGTAYAVVVENGRIILEEV